MVISIRPNLFDSAIKVTPRMRAWMFSSVRSGRRPANGPASMASKAATAGSIRISS